MSQLACRTAPWVVGVLLACLPLTAHESREVTNLKAFARLYGYVRYFHPSDEAAEVDWDKLAVHGVGVVRDAADDAALADRLVTLFRPVAPTLRVFADGAEVPEPAQPLPEDADVLTVVAWRHLGYGTARAPDFLSARSNRESWRMPKAGFAPLIQRVDARPYQGRKIRLSLDLRARVGHDGRAQAFLRVDRAELGSGFFNNMDVRPVQQDSWRRVTIEGEVAFDALTLNFGSFISGRGRMYCDNFVLEYLDADGTWKNIALENPSFEAPAADIPGWLTTMDDKGYEYEVVPRDDGAGRCLSVTSRELRVLLEPFEELPPPETVLHKALSPGLRCKLPVTLYSDETKTLGGDAAALAALKTALDADPLYDMRGSREAVRLGDAVIVWNVLRHFHPSMDTDGAKAEALLDDLLDAAFQSSDGPAYLAVMRVVLARVGDPGAYIGHPDDLVDAEVPLRLRRLHGRLVVVGSNDRRVRPHDIVTSIDGKDAEACYQEGLTRFAGSAESRGFRALDRLLVGPLGSSVRLGISRDGVARTIDITRETRRNRYAVDWFDEPVPGIFYYNPGSFRHNFFSVAERLEGARGLIIDLRDGAKNYLDLFARFLEAPVAPPVQCFPKILLPDGEGRTWWEDTWTLSSVPPRYKARLVFLADGGTRGDAELLLYVVRKLKLGEIVGDTTAGAPGRANSIWLPGGYSFGFSGSRVRVGDRDPLYGIGVAPTVPLTEADLFADHEDPYLAKALALLTQADKAP